VKPGITDRRKAPASGYDAGAFEYEWVFVDIGIFLHGVL
jgi:hypothetical protein